MSSRLVDVLCRWLIAEPLTWLLFKLSEPTVTRISRVAHYPIDAADDDTAAA